MLLCSIEDVLLIPGLANTAGINTPYLNRMIGAADRSICRYCKRELVLASYIWFTDGQNQRELRVPQTPVWVGNTTIAAGSSGQALPQATINVSSTAGFSPGTQGDPNALAPTIAVQVGLNAFVSVQYTGTTPTSFTGCTGGTGTMNSAAGQNRVFSPVVWQDPGGFGGQSANPFPEPVNGVGSGTILLMGNNFEVVLDSASRSYSPQPGLPQSHRGLIRKIGGMPGPGVFGWYPEYVYQGKLAGSRLPIWNRGDGNIKVAYNAGYKDIPDDLRWACATVVAQIVRTMPNGGNMSSESLGGYSYSMLYQSDNPEFGDIRRALAPYREISS